MATFMDQEGCVQRAQSRDFAFPRCILESRSESSTRYDKCNLREEPDRVSAEEYARVTASGDRKPVSHRVILLPLRKGPPEEAPDPALIFGDSDKAICAKRAYLAQLAKELNARHAAFIVFDLSFQPLSCDETSQLRDAVQRSTAPVVLGLWTEPPQVDPKGACQIVDASVDFGNRRGADGIPTNEPAVHAGLMRANRNPQKAPLSWLVYKTDEAFNTGEEPSDMETLPMVAASVVDKELPQKPKLIRLRTMKQHPFISFIPENDLPTLRALSLMCNSSAKDLIVEQYQVNCVNHEQDPVNIADRIVVIGPEDDDHELFPNHLVSGVYLQGNYIEALLDDRYFLPVNPTWNYALFAMWLVLLYLVFWIQPELALLLSLAVGFLARYVMSELVLKEGIYAEIWIQQLGAIALGLKYIDSRGHRAMDALAEWRAASRVSRPRHSTRTSLKVL
jgi:hypothetical protein